MLSIEVGDNGRNNNVPGSYGKKVFEVMESAGYTKVLEKSIDHLYVRNDFRSHFLNMTENQDYCDITRNIIIFNMLYVFNLNMSKHIV